MFGKEQPDVVTDEEVGEYIEQLKRDGMEDLDELARLSEDSTSGTQGTK